MDQDELHSHLSEAVSGARRTGRLGLTARLLASCWPGGPQDRYVPVGAVWLRQWGPQRAAVTTPVCSCASGFCDVCN
jgi:hypothetical protein